MSIARVVELTATSPDSFEDALRQAVARASKTLRNVRSAWVKEQEVQIDGGQIVTFKVNVLVSFVLDDANDEMQEGDGPRPKSGQQKQSKGSGRRASGRAGRR